MAIYILNDLEMPAYTPLKIQSEISMIKKLNRKRIPTKTIRRISELSVMADDPDSVFLIPHLISQMEPTLTDAISFCNRNNIPVIVLHESNSTFPYLTFNGILGHFYENARVILKYCIGTQKSQLALFGFNNTFPDINYAEAINNLYPAFGQENLFQLSSTFEECFGRFFPCRSQYDSILFPNDHIAIAFIRKISQIDPDYLQSHFLISISNTFLSKLFYTSITSITYSRSSIVHAVSSIYRTVLHNRENLLCVNYLLPSELFIRKSTQYVPLSASNTVLPRISGLGKPPLHFESPYIDYSTEPVMRPILTVENLLCSFDKMDFQILLHLLEGMTNAEISGKLFITLQALRYRIHRMFEQTDTANKHEFIKLISKYVSTENLENYLKDSSFF